MKILKIIHGFPPDYSAGSEVYTKTLVDELQKKHQVILFSRIENEYELDFKITIEKENKFTHYKINMPRKKEAYNIFEVNKIFRKIIKFEKPEIAHIEHLHHLSTGIIDELKIKKIPIIFTLHDFWLMCPRGQFIQRNSDGKKYFEICSKQENSKCAKVCYSASHNSTPKEIEFWTNWITERMNATKRISETVDLFISPSNYLKNRFILDFKIPKDKIFHLNYGFKIPKKEFPKTKHKYTFGYIGTHIPSKGVNLLIEAFELLNIDAELKIYGLNTNSDKNYFGNKKIKFMGEYENEELYKKIFPEIDCIIVPSIWTENSPLVIQEAMIAKVPVITADTGGMKELIKHKKNGILFRHRNKNDLSKKILFAFRNKNLMKELGNFGFLNSKNGDVLNIESHTKKLLELYKLVIKNAK